MSPTDLEGVARALVESAQHLNEASNKLAVPITALDDFLQQLNLGIVVWQRVRRDETRGQWTQVDVGYTRVGRRWGLAVQEKSGRLGDDAAAAEHLDVWFYNEAPRHFRIAAIESLPTLFEAILKVSRKATDKINASTEAAWKVVADVQKDPPA